MKSANVGGTDNWERKISYCGGASSGPCSGLSIETATTQRLYTLIILHWLTV